MQPLLLLWIFREQQTYFLTWLGVYPFQVTDDVDGVHLYALGRLLLHASASGPHRRAALCPTKQLEMGHRRALSQSAGMHCPGLADQVSFEQQERFWRV